MNAFWMPTGGVKQKHVDKGKRDLRKGSGKHAYFYSFFFNSFLVSPNPLFFFFFFLIGYACGMWKFLGQGSNPCLSCVLCQSSSNAWTLPAVPQWNLPTHFLILHIFTWLFENIYFLPLGLSRLLPFSLSQPDPLQFLLAPLSPLLYEGRWGCLFSTCFVWLGV